MPEQITLLKITLLSVLSRIRRRAPPSTLARKPRRIFATYPPAATGALMRAPLAGVCWRMLTYADVC